MAFFVFLTLFFSEKTRLISYRDTNTAFVITGLPGYKLNNKRHRVNKCLVLTLVQGLSVCLVSEAGQGRELFTLTINIA